MITNKDKSSESSDKQARVEIHSGIGSSEEEDRSFIRSRKTKPDLTNGSVIKLLFQLAIPTMGTIALHTSYSVVDTIWVGRYLGKEAISAISIWFYMFMIFIFFNQLVGIGSVALISQHYGARKFEDTKTIIGQTFMFKFYLALTVSILGWIFGDDIYRKFIDDPKVCELGVVYSRVLFTALPVYFSSFTLNTSFNGIGDMVKPFQITLATTIFNFILDPLLIVGINSKLLPFLPDLLPGTGIFGAALATALAQLLAFGLGVWIFLSGRTYLRLEIRNLGLPIWSWIKKIAAIGIPTAVGELVRNIAMMIIGKLIATFGTAIFAAEGIIGQFFGMIWIPLGGLGQAVVTLVGQNLGARLPHRSEESVWKALIVGIAVVIPLVVVGEIFAPGLVSVFNREHDVIIAGTKIIRIVLLAFIPMAVSAIIGSAFWGAGDTTPPMIVGVIDIWLIQLPLIWLIVKLSKHPIIRLVVLSANPDPIYYAWIPVVIGEIIAAVAIFWIFRLGIWKKDLV